MAFPLFLSIRLSLGDIVKTVGYQIEWTGFDHYIRAITVDLEFIPMLLAVAGEALVKLPLVIVFSLILAIMVNKSIRFRTFFRTVYFLPFLIGSGEVLKLLLQQEVDKKIISISDGSLIPYQIIQYLGDNVVKGVDGFFGIIVVVLWSSGVQILLFLAGLQAIPASLYEAAKVDGATEWEMFWKVTLPMITPIMQLCIVFTIVDSFTNSGNPMLEYINDHAFRMVQMEYASAAGWIYFIFIIILVSAFIIPLNRYIQSMERKGDKKHAK
ncbi:MAG TPA: sugar ABC transporter permease [Clostridiales bacterium]|nr:sugar ABC transporter permease [Clostridiales bacterium]